MSRVERVGRTGSLSYSRIRGAYAMRQGGASTIDKPLPVEAAFYAQNNTDLSSENHLVAYDNYYRNLDKLEKEFEFFLKDADSLKEQVKEEKNKETIDKNSSLYRKIRTLINKYNATIDALVYIDKNYNTNNIKELEFIVLNHSERLENIGIVTRNMKLEINGGVFWSKFLESDNPFDEMFQPLSRLIMALYIKFRNIMKVRQNEYSPFPEGYKGTIINEAF